MPELVAEVIDRSKELTVGQTFRVFWALKLPTVIAGIFLMGSAFTLGRYTGSRDSARNKTPQYALGLTVRPFDETLPKLSDAEFDGRSLEEYGAEISRRRAKWKELQVLQNALQNTKSVYATETGRRFAWRGVVTGFSVPFLSPERKIISVGIKSGEYEADCLFEEAGNIGRLLSLKIGDTTSITGILTDNGELVRCEFDPSPISETTKSDVR